MKRLGDHIQFILDALGDTEEDRAENRQRLLAMRKERTIAQREIVKQEALLKAPQKIPTETLLRGLMKHFAGILNEASGREDELALAKVKFSKSCGCTAIPPHR